MLAIRMRRTGRKGHAQFRVVVQDSRFSPSSGRVVAYLGSYDPHAKTAALDKPKIDTYLGNGARPSDRAAALFKQEGITLPKWVKETQPKKRAIRHPEKLRRNRPAEEAKPEAAVAEPVETAAEEAPEAKAEAPDQAETSEPAAETPEAAPEAAEETPDEPAAKDADSAAAESSEEPAQ
jgi:small subunit ribosomal protein S16